MSLKTLIQERNSLLDTQKEKIEAYNRRLKELSPGVEASIPIGEDGALGYGRYGSDWCLLWIESGSTTRLTDAPIRARVACVPRLSEIEAQLAVALEIQIEQLKKQLIG